MFCQSREEEIADRQRVLLLTEHFVALELYASPTPFCTPIHPRRHMASFGDISRLCTFQREFCSRCNVKLLHPLEFNGISRAKPLVS
jgi:hypothetical protein